MWLVFALASIGALKVTTAFFLLLEVILAVTFLFLVFITSRAYWVLRFEDAHLYLTDCGSHQTYHVYDVPASDFVFRQSKSQKAKNRCDLKIRNTVFAIYDAEQYEEMTRYIAENFE